MFLQSFVIGISILAAAPSLAIEFKAPRATNVAADLPGVLGFSPAPTKAPSPQELKKRALLYNRAVTTDTCGYFDGVETDSYTCGIGSACIWNTVDEYFGCCSVDGSGNFITSDCPAVLNPYTSCYPYSWATDCTGSCYTENRVCDSTLPYCGVAYLIDDTQTYTEFFCNSISEHTTLIVSPSFTTTADSSGDSGTKILIVTTTDVNGPAITAPPTPNPSKSKSKSGAIAGGVIGGLVFIAAVAAGTILYLRKRKLTQREQAQMEVSQVGQ